MLKKYGVILLAIILVVSLITGCSSNGDTQETQGDSNANANNEETIILRGVTAWPENDILSAGFGIFEKNVEELSKGRVQIEYAGGPESIPSPNQGNAVRTGAVDIALLAAAYYVDVIPEALALSYSELTTEGERASGGIDYLNEIHNEKLNAQILGRASGDIRFNLYLNKPVSSIADFKGMRIRVASDHVSFIKALKGDPILMPPTDIFTSIERGVIDGLVYTDMGITDLGLGKEIKYQVFPSFGNMDTVIIINLDVWKQLPEDIQDILMEASRVVEKELPPIFKEYFNDEQQKLKDLGVQRIDLSQELQDIANDAAWEWMDANMGENGAKLSELFRKK